MCLWVVVVSFVPTLLIQGRLYSSVFLSDHVTDEKTVLLWGAALVYLSLFTSRGIVWKLQLT